MNDLNNSPIDLKPYLPKNDSNFILCGWGKVPPELLEIYPKISVSGLMAMCESPADYESTYILKEREETKAMRLGTAVHIAVLEPEKFDITYFPKPIKYPEYVLKTNDDIKKILKENKQIVTGNKEDLINRLRGTINCEIYMTEDEYLDKERMGKELLSDEDYTACIRISKRFKEHKMLSVLMSGGEAEKLGWALHRETKTIITFKADKYKLFKQRSGIFGGVCIDVKKFLKVKYRNFIYAVDDNNLYVQAALYSDILLAITNEVHLFCWALCRDKPPYHVVPYEADDAWLEAGHNKYNKKLIEFKECLETNKWPTYSDDIVTLKITDRALNDPDNQGEEE